MQPEFGIPAFRSPSSVRIPFNDFKAYWLLHSPAYDYIPVYLALFQTP